MTVLAEELTFEGRTWDEVMEDTMKENNVETLVFEEAPVATVAEVKNNNDLYKGLAIGFLAGALAGAAAWFYERNQRMKVLKQLELTMFIANGLAENKVKVNYGKEEIELAEMTMNNPDDLILTIKGNIDKVKMSKKEKERWKKTMHTLIELTLVWDKKEKINKLKQQTVKTEEVTETLVEN